MAGEPRLREQNGARLPRVPDRLQLRLSQHPLGGDQEGEEEADQDVQERAVQAGLQVLQEGRRRMPLRKQVFLSARPAQRGEVRRGTAAATVPVFHGAVV